MANTPFYMPLGVVLLTLVSGGIDDIDQESAARNRRLALFKNDICYTNRYSSAPPVMRTSAACRVLSSAGGRRAYQQFELELQRDSTMKARALEELRLMNPRRSRQVRRDLRRLRQDNQGLSPSPESESEAW